MNKEMKILGIVVGLTLLVYWGVEPFAHSQMHPPVKKADFKFQDMKDFDISQGSPTKGKALVEANCIGCHSIEKANFPAPLDNETASQTYGVVPPDLSSAGYIYDEKFLANYIKNPVKAFHTEHKFDAGDGKGNPFPMPNYEWMSDKDMFPSLMILRRYLKLVIAYYIENNLMDCSVIEIEKQNHIFKIEYTPRSYPKPNKLKLI